MTRRLSAARAAGFTLNVVCAALLQMGAGATLSLVPSSAAFAQAITCNGDGDDNPSDNDGDKFCVTTVRLNAPRRA